MSKADKMFEKLGYRKETIEDSKGNVVAFCHQYIKYDGSYKDTILFNDSTQLMFVESLLFEREREFIFYPELLQAINEKAKELGWNE